MSDQSIVALIAVVATALVSLSGLALNMWNVHQERNERYRIALYDNRLEVHQRAFQWMQELQVPLALANSGIGNDDRQIEKRRHLQSKANEARQWWTENCLLLDPKSRQSFISFTFRALEACEGNPDKLQALFNDWGETVKSIEHGIKMKHIDMDVLRTVPAELQHD